MFKTGSFAAPHFHTGLANFDFSTVSGKYNLLAVPVVDRSSKMMGMVVIDDIVWSLIKTRKRSILRAE